MIPAFMKEFQITPLQVGLLSSSYFYSYLTMQLPAGMLVDRFGARKVLSLGIILFTAACWLFAHTTNFYVAQVSRILMGLGAAPVISTTFALVAHWFPANRFALIIGLTDTLGMLGGIAGQAYLAGWVEQIGWRSTITGCFFVGIIIALFIVLIVRDQPKAIDSPEQTVNPFTQLSEVIKLPQIWLNGIYVAMVWGAAIAFTGLWSVPFLQAQYQLSLTTAASISSVVFVGIATATPITGWLVDNFSHLRRPLMFGWTIAGLVSLTLAIYCTHLPLLLLIILLFLFGCSTSSYIISFALVRETTSATARATAMGFTNMMSLLVGSPILQPIIGYFLKAHTGNSTIATNIHFAASDFKKAFIILPICLLIALLSAAFINTTTPLTNCQSD